MSLAVLQRDAERTRRALLAAAEQALVSWGPAFSLDAVAKEAGVSKGGLLHHFRSRDALLVGLVEAWIQRFDEAVQRHLDPNDNRPGRVCRAHIRAAFDDEVAVGAWMHPTVQATMIGVPGVLDRARVDAERWERDRAADGLHPQRVLLISRALDGQAMNDLFNSMTNDSGRTQLRDLLLALSQGTGPLTTDSI